MDMSTTNIANDEPTSPPKSFLNTFKDKSERQKFFQASKSGLAVSLAMVPEAGKNN
jgi:hypothetical protein